MVFHTVPRRSLKRGLKFFHGNVFRFLAHPSLLLSICMTKLNDFILRNKSAELSTTDWYHFCDVPGADLRTIQRRRWRGKGTLGKLGWGLTVCLDIKRFQISQGILTEINKKSEKNSHPNIQTKFHTKTKIEKLWHLWQNSDPKRLETLTLCVVQTYMAQNKCIIGVTEGTNLSPSLLFFLASFLWFFFRLQNIKQCVVIFPIYVPIFPIPPPVTSFSFSSWLPSFVLPHSGKEDSPPPAPAGLRSLQSCLTTCCPVWL